MFNHMTYNLKPLTRAAAITKLETITEITLITAKNFTGSFPPKKIGG